MRACTPVPTPACRRLTEGLSEEQQPEAATASCDLLLSCLPQVRNNPVHARQPCVVGLFLPGQLPVWFDIA